MTGSGPLWTRAEALEAVGALDARGQGPDWRASGVSIDTRTLEPGDLFVALKQARDGHDFVADALAKGAAAALVSRVPEGAASDAPLLIVSDTQAGLEALGAYRRAQVSGKICAITGSVGKTGTKEALGDVLAAQGRTHRSVKSYNNLFGVPLTLARMPADTEFGVFEIGMNHADEITPLSKQVQPHAVLITTVQAVHIENFDSVEGIADAKSEIFDGLLPGGTAVIPFDNEHYERILGHAKRSAAGRIIGFGAGEGADIRLLELTAGSTGSDVRVSFLGREIALRVGAPGAHLVMNALGLLGLVAALGADVDAAARALADLTPPEGRGRRYELPWGAGGSLLLIDESYNANPASMRAAIDTLGGVSLPPGARRIAVLGDMLELGDFSPRFHADLAETLEAAGVDLVFCAGELMAHLWDALPSARQGAYRPTAQELGALVTSALKPGDAVMVKGSFGSRMGPLVETLKEHSARLAGTGPSLEPSGAAKTDKGA